jgi:hypothetical protein
MVHSVTVHVLFVVQAKERERLAKKKDTGPSAVMRLAL